MILVVTRRILCSLLILFMPVEHLTVYFRVSVLSSLVIMLPIHSGL